MSPDEMGVGNKTRDVEERKGMVGAKTEIGMRMIWIGGCLGCLRSGGRRGIFIDRVVDYQ